MELEIGVRDDGHWSVVELRGEVDVATAPRLREAVVELIERGRNAIVVDLGGVWFMDSTGLGVLVGCLRRVKERGGTLVLAAPQPPVLRVLTLTGLSTVFRVSESVAAATEAV